MLYLKRILIILISVIALLLAGYTGLWFYTAYKIKLAISDYAAKQDSPYQISYDSLKISGFPFKAKLKFRNFKTEYTNGNKNLAVTATYETLRIQSNITLDKFKISPSGKLNYIIANNSKESRLEDIAKGDYYFKLSTDKSNAIELIKSSIDSQFFSNLKIKEFHFKVNDLTTIDSDTGNKVLHSSADVKITINHDKKEPIYGEIKKNINIDILGDRCLIPGLDFILASKLKLSSDIQVLTKDEKSTAVFPSINIRNFSLSADDTKISFNGTIKDDLKTSNFKVNVTAENLDILLQTLIKEEFLSIEKYSIIISILKDILGDEFPQDMIKFEVKNDKFGIKLGEAYFTSLLNHIKNPSRR